MLDLILGLDLEARLCLAIQGLYMPNKRIKVYPPMTIIGVVVKIMVPFWVP